MKQPRSLPYAAPLICILVAGCGSANRPTRTVDAAQLETSIATSVQSQRHQSAAVTCPTGEPIRTGNRFYCAAEAGAAVTPFLVTVKPNGKLSYTGVRAPNAPRLAMGGVELAIMRAERADHLDPRTVACPAQMPRQRGLEFVCVASLTGRRSTSFIVREINSLGRVSFRPR